MRTTIRFEDSLLRRAKAHAAKNGISLNDFISNSVKLALLRRDVVSAPTIPTGSGDGLLPAIDLDDSASLLDSMEPDLRYSLASVPVRMAAERALERP